MRAATIALLFACALACAVPAAAQAPAATDPVTTLLRRAQEILNAGDRAAFAALFSAVPQAQIEQYTSNLFLPEAVRTVVRERDRGDLEGAPKGDGYRVVVEVFTETAGRAKLLTAGLDLRRPAGGDVNSWRIVRAEGISAIEGLFRLRLNTATQYTARNLELRSEDLIVSLQDGAAFEVDTDSGVTGLVLIGRGEMRFAPTPQSERGQLKLFAGAETVAAQFETAFIRVNPVDYPRVVTTSALTKTAPDPRQVRRAQEIFSRESPKSYVVDLQDLSSDTWHLLPPGNDFLAEVQTRRWGTLTYTRSNAQAEDVQLFQRDRRRTIALYASQAKLAARGRFYSDDVLREYDVLDYNIEAAVDPERQYLQARARLAIRARASLATLTMRLADSLDVSSVTSVEYGRLLHLKVSNQNTVMISLPQTLTQDSDITIVVTYAGRISPELLETETAQASQDIPPPPDLPPSTTEPNYLLSNRSLWYPQNPVSDYATATLRMVVPDGYTCVATGEPVPTSAAVSLRDILTLPEGKPFVFRANQPLRYLSFIVSRFERVAEKTVAATDEAAGDPMADRINIAVDANPRLKGRGRALTPRIEDILRFYGTLVNDSPYPSATIALIESQLPGGHSPGYFVVLNDPVPSAQPLVWRNDPAAFEGYPDFFLAHELAHQWWGQAIGWKNYHEQWISEGFAQYFAALYAQKSRGDKVFVDMLRQFRRWSLSESDQGPIHLGYRLGHIKSDVRVFRALVYNKGAAVLHMLRRLLGDDVFFASLRRFYQDRKFQKAGTDDVQRAFELESGRDLDRFFERWIYSTDLPRIAYHSTIGDGEVTVRFDQLSEELFDVPVTVTIVYSDGRTRDVMVPVTNKRVEQRIKTDGPVRQVQINRDFAAVAEFDETGDSRQ